MKRFFYLLIVATILVVSSEEAVNEKIQCAVTSLINGSLTIADKDGILYRCSFGAGDQGNTENDFFIVLLSSKLRPEIIDLIKGLN